MKPAFTIRQQSPIYVGPTADLLPGLLPEGRVVVVCDATIIPSPAKSSFP